MERGAPREIRPINQHHVSSSNHRRRAAMRRRRRRTLSAETAPIDLTNPSRGGCLPVPFAAGGSCRSSATLAAEPLLLRRFGGYFPREAHSHELSSGGCAPEDCE